MSKSYLIFLSFILIFARDTFGQNFDGLTSRIFFNVDLKSQDSKLIPYFKSRPELQLKKDTGWTMYPPTFDTDNLPVITRFIFNKHPTLSTNIKRGHLMIFSSAKSPKIIGMSLSLLFISKEAFTEVYESIRESYTKNSFSIIKRPDIAYPYEVTKYHPKDGTDYVILTKGGADGEFYFNIAYNYQGYDW